MIRILIVIILLSIFRGTSFSQSNYLMSLENIIKVDDFTYSFDVFVENVNGDFQLTSYQCSFLFECNDMFNDEFTFLYFDSSSELSNEPVLGLETRETDGHPELTFASNAGSDIIKEKQRVGTFLLKRKFMFDDSSFKVDWNFEGVNSTIITGKDFNNITNPENFISPFTLTEIDDKKVEITDYRLYQNYPNPFNPSTIISYQLPVSGHVSLKVFDAIGREVATLVNEVQSDGNYEIRFDGSSLASGVYFFRLFAGKFVQTKKMVLAK